VSRPPIAVKAGERFGRLTVVEDRQGKAKRVLVRCSCGSEPKEVAVAELLRRENAVRSCGCLSRRALVQGRYAARHGQARRSGKSPLYELWRDLRRRYPNEVCERWQEFRNFQRDLGPRPSPAHRLVRAREDRPWGPRNCGWASASSRGEANPQARIDAATADTIRMLCARGLSRAEVARHVRLSPTQVGRIVRRENWV
jgi:hypothetical protein